MLVKLIGFYQRYLSPQLPARCRFYPSCSEYTRQAVGKWGEGRGLWLGIKRMLKCHPFHKGGFDPIP